MRKAPRLKADVYKRQKHGLPYRLAVFSFEDDLEAKKWALDTQKSRRNLTVNELCKIAMKLRPEIEARAKANQGERTDISATLPKSQPVDTRKELAEAVGVGERTMGKAMKLSLIPVSYTHLIAEEVHGNAVEYLCILHPVCRHRRILPDEIRAPQKRSARHGPLGALLSLIHI